MVESVKVKAEGSVFSIKKDTILSDLIPCLNLLPESLLARLGELMADRKKIRRFS